MPLHREAVRKHYADAFEAWDRWAAANIDRRREYPKARDLRAKRPLSHVSLTAETISRLPRLPSSPRPPCTAAPRRKLHQRRNQLRNPDATASAAFKGTSAAAIRPPERASSHTRRRATRTGTATHFGRSTWEQVLSDMSRPRAYFSLRTTLWSANSSSKRCARQASPLRLLLARCSALDRGKVSHAPGADRRRSSNANIRAGVLRRQHAVWRAERHRRREPIWFGSLLGRDRTCQNVGPDDAVWEHSKLRFR